MKKSTMKLLDVIDYDSINYKKPTMTLLFPNCSMKCNKDYGDIICHNYNLLNSSTTEISKEAICERYIRNPLTEAICCSGLEPFDSFMDLISLVDCIRNKYQISDDIVIYTGYTEGELKTGNFGKDVEVSLTNFNYLISNYKNIIIKYGRYIPNDHAHFDKVLGVNLISSNQYAEKVS